MAKKIIMRCSECGKWCKTEKRGFFSRFDKGTVDAIEKLSKKGGVLGDKVGMRRGGRFIGKIIGQRVGTWVGVKEAILGYEYQFECPQCRHKWDTDKDTDDQSERYYKEVIVTDDYLKQLPSQPYTDRKTILVIDRYSANIDIDKQIIVLTKADAEKALQFPTGHPHVNQLYVGHPAEDGFYVPFDDYQLLFVEEQVRELCELAQALGAKRIKVTCLNEKSSDSTENQNITASGSGSRKAFRAEGQYQGKNSQHLIERIRQSVEMQQTYSPTLSPYIPEGLVWYKHEQMTSWQRLVRQRVNGELNEHKERLQTSKSQMLDANELKQIQANLTSLLAEANIGIDIAKEYNFQVQDNAILEIEIDFVPIGQLQGRKPMTNRY